MTDSSDKILIMGVGNLLMGDEGIGIHVIKKMEKARLPQNAELLDGGTGGFHLLSYLQNYPVIIIIDATMDNKPAGTISVIEPKFASDFPKSLSAHDIGLKDLVESTVLLGELPKIYLITISIENIKNMVIGLSGDVEKSVPAVIEKIYVLMESISSNSLSDKNPQNS